MILSLSIAPGRAASARFPLKGIAADQFRVLAWIQGGYTFRATLILFVAGSELENKDMFYSIEHITPPLALRNLDFSIHLNLEALKLMCSLLRSKHWKTRCFCLELDLLGL